MRQILIMFFTGRFLVDVANFLDHKGLEGKEWLAQSGYSERQLSEKDFYIDFKTVSDTLSWANAKWGLTNMGIEMGEEVNLATTEYVDQLMNQCSTVEEAFAHAVAFSRLISDAMDCSLIIEEGSFRVDYQLNPNWALQDDFAIAQVLNLALVCTTSSLYCLTKKQYYPQEVNFHYPKPKLLSKYYKAFNCHLNFNQGVSSIVFRKAILNEKVVADRIGLREQLEREAVELIDTLGQERLIIYKVKKAILQGMGPETMGVNKISDQLGMTARSLQRKLKNEGQTFKGVESEIKFSLVKKLMRSGHQNLDEIAYLVGYSEASALVRAFKNWTGHSPRRYFRDI